MFFESVTKINRPKKCNLAMSLNDRILRLENKCTEEKLFLHVAGREKLNIMLYTCKTLIKQFCDFLNPFLRVIFKNLSNFHHLLKYLDNSPVIYKKNTI